ncbi:MAG: hypothetical protein VYB24_02710, partial [Pseudomonadota bacterium]|nr:hypothetical protein [Pseudomonadota bacterium]
EPSFVAESAAHGEAAEHSAAHLSTELGLMVFSVLVAFAGIVLLGKQLRRVIRRDDDYYND